MKTFFTMMTFLISTTALASVQQGQVTMKIDSSHAQVSAKNLSIKEGDRVVIFEKTCQGPKVQLCKKEKIGTGVVSRVINETASEIKVDGTAHLKAGLLIEKE